MRDLSIAYGSSCYAKKWSNKTITFDELKERLKVTIRTPESAEEYRRMTKLSGRQPKITAALLPEFNRRKSFSILWLPALIALMVIILSHSF